MGLRIITHKKGYKAFCSMSDEQLHKKNYLTEDELKTLMIERVMQDFFEKVIIIEKNFLENHNVDGSRFLNIEKPTALEWIVDNYDSIEDEALKILDRLNIKIN